MRAIILSALIFTTHVFSLGWTGWDDAISTVGLPKVTPAPDPDDADVSLEGIYSDDEEEFYGDEDEIDEDEDEEGEDYEDEEDDEAYEAYDEELEIDQNPHPGDETPQYHYEDPWKSQYHPREVAYNFPHVLNQSIPIDETPIDIDEDTVEARLGKRHNIGGLYYCKKDSQCQYRDGKFHKCYNLPQGWRNQVMTFKADRHDFVCTTCADVDCHRCSQLMRFPGRNHVDKHSIQSYICIPWDTSSGGATGTAEDMDETEAIGVKMKREVWSDLEESFSPSKRANARRDPMRLHEVPSNGFLKYRDSANKVQLRRVGALGKCHAVDENTHPIRAVKITVNDKFRMQCRIYSKPDCRGEHRGSAGFAMYQERWNLKHLGWESIPSYECIPYYVAWKNAHHKRSLTGNKRDTFGAGPAKSMSWPTVDSILLHWQKDQVPHKRRIRTLGECHQFRPKNPPIEGLSLIMEGDHVQCLVYRKDYCQGKGAWLGPSKKRTTLTDMQPRELHFDDFRSFKCDWAMAKFKKSDGFIGKPGEEENQFEDDESTAYIPYGPEEEADEIERDDDENDRDDDEDHED